VLLLLLLDLLEVLELGLLVSGVVACGSIGGVGHCHCSSAMKSDGRARSAFDPRDFALSLGALAGLAQNEEPGALGLLRNPLLVDLQGDAVSGIHRDFERLDAVGEGERPSEEL